jgi:hypothetical protein
MSDVAPDRRFSPHERMIRALPVILFGLAALVVMFILPRMPQAQSYHRFKDDRPLLGLPNALNVVSNIPFLAIGVCGLWYFLAGTGARPGRTYLLPAERWPFVVMFLGVALTGFGSSYYHLAPDNDRLVWDRLPMAIGFMGLIAAIIAERISIRLASWLLWPLVAIGLGSVLHWHWTERHEQGDMRLYLFVQGYALFFVLVTPLLFPARYTRTADWYIGLGWYVLAKVCESLDGPIYALTGYVLSGHTLKHLIGAVSTYWLLHMLLVRRPLPTPSVFGKSLECHPS